MRWRLGTSSHPKILRLVAECGERAFRALSTLWEHCAVHRKDGRLSGMDPTDIAIAAGWPEAPSSFVPAMLRLRLLDGAPPKSRVHDWSDNQPWVRGQRARSDASTKAAIVRWAARAGLTPEEYAKSAGLDAPAMRRAFGGRSMRTAMRNDADRNGPSPSPIPTPIPIPIPSPSAGNPAGSGPARFAPPDTGPKPADSGGSLLDRLAADREASAEKQRAFDAEFDAWVAQGNPPSQVEFRRQRLASLRTGTA